MKNRPHILRELGRRYESTQAGRTGVGERDLLLDYEEFLRESSCGDAEARHIAERDLAVAAHEGVLMLVPHRRDSKLIQQIRFSREREQALFSHIGEDSPTQRRHTLAQRFADAARLAVPEEWQVTWAKFCSRLENAARLGESVAPFERGSAEMTAELLSLVPKLLTWRGESLLRFASCVLCGNSKRLESLSSRLEQILQQLTEGKLRSLEDVGIVANPRFVLLHGPLKLRLNGQWLDFGLLTGPFRLSEVDITRADAIETSVRRCLTVENETTFHELAKLHSGELLIQTSFPGSGTLALLRRLPRWSHVRLRHHTACRCVAGLLRRGAMTYFEAMATTVNVSRTGQVEPWLKLSARRRFTNPLQLANSAAASGMMIRSWRVPRECREDDYLQRHGLLKNS